MVSYTEKTGKLNLITNSVSGSLHPNKMGQHETGWNIGLFTTCFNISPRFVVAVKESNGQNVVLTRYPQNYENKGKVTY